MPKSVSAAGTPFKQILTDGQRTTESPHSNNSHLHHFAQSATERDRSNNSHIYRFAQNATEIREGGGRASAGRASRSNSATASMRSSSASSNTRSLGQLRRQKGYDSGSSDSWARGVTDFLFNPVYYVKAGPEGFSEHECPSTAEDKPDEPSTSEEKT
ncbi:MAG: hypothetical protein P8104_09745 [Gammaproteobacteria bacterium]